MRVGEGVGEIDGVRVSSCAFGFLEGWFSLKGDTLVLVFIRYLFIVISNFSGLFFYLLWGSGFLFSIYLEVF